MSPRVLFALYACVLASLPAPLGAQCLLCTEPTAPGAPGRIDAPLAVEISSGLDFDRVAVTAPAGGSIVLDPVGRSRTVAGALANLGGLVMTGSATVRGEPGRAVRVSLPGEVILRGARGGDARISRLVTDLPAVPRLGPDGSLRFSFGGRLVVTRDMEGDYRGRVPITVEYQ